MIASATVLGAGSWGTAIAAMLAARGLKVQFWGRDAALMQQIDQARRNARYLPDLELPPQIQVTSELGKLEPADLLVFVVPSKAMHATAALAASAGLGKTRPIVLSCTKGIELNSGLRMSQILGQHFSDCPLAALTGPNHAEEVAQRLATAAVAAAPDMAIAEAVQDAFRVPWFRCYTSDDLAGVEWAGAMKNPYAIAAGIAKGLQLGDNAIAALVTRALAEMVRLGVHQGGRMETFYGLSGVGDLVATCYSEHSRNHRLGLALGRGQKLADVLAASSMIAEGVPNTLSLYQCAQTAGVRTPLLNAMHDVLYADKPPQLALKELLSRELRAEAE